jgi:sulfatase maturation enzyme AslB (radical SAM superfamily)
VQLQLLVLLPKKKAKRTLSVSTTKAALDFFLPHFCPGTYLNFSGGEPLLAFDAIEKTVAYIDSDSLFQLADIHFSLTTNASLLTPNIADFLDHNHFLVLLSFDGTAQEIARKKGSFNSTVSVIESLMRYPNIGLIVTSVFTSETIGCLTESIRFITSLGVPEITVTFANLPPWDEASLAELREQLSDVNNYLLPIARKGGTIALRNYQKQSGGGVFACAGGSDRLALAADGTLWGCHLFSDYCLQQGKTLEYSQYCFGDIENFIRKHREIHPEIAANYSNLTQKYFYTPKNSCSRCPEIEECQICPISAAFASSEIGAIPQWTCEIKKIVRRSRDRFWEQVGA